jgi:hypothetical protein
VSLSTSSVSRGFALGGIFILVLMFTPEAARGSTGLVLNNNVFGPGSFAQVVADAAPGATIMFDTSVTGIIPVHNMDINKDVVIVGPGAATLTIDAELSGRGFVIGNRVTASISDLTILNGKSFGGPAGNGGGIYNDGLLTLEGVVIANSEASAGGGGIYNKRELTLKDSTIVGNSAGSFGGGIMSINATMSIARSAIINNQAGLYAAGIYTFNSATITNSTVSGNRQSGINGSRHGIYNEGSLISTNNTIRDELVTVRYDQTTLRNTIVWECIGDGTLDLQGVNVIRTLGGGCGSPVAGIPTMVGDLSSSFIGVEPLIGPLADKGGPTMTHALLSGSPALAAGSDALAPATDQRGVLRPQGPQSDVGAFEAAHTADLYVSVSP